MGCTQFIRLQAAERLTLGRRLLGFQLNTWLLPEAVAAFTAAAALVA
jgi:hypothetical protein